MPAFVAAVASRPRPVLKAVPPAPAPVSEKMVNFLKSAVECRITLRLDYAPGMREVEPHALGMSSEGQLLLRVWQTEGASESGEQANWKLLRVDRIGTTLAYGPTFKVRDGYKKGDRSMKGGILAEV